MPTKEDKKVTAGYAPWLIGVALWAVLWGAWALVRPSLTIFLGSIDNITQNYRFFLSWYVLAGSLTAVSLAKGLDGRPAQTLTALLRRGTDRTWVSALCAAALGLGLAAHFLVLQEMPVTDDESAYLFAARTVASGQVSVPSPPDKLFWDRAFMYNDGTFYSQYFLGWPALLAPFTLLNLEVLANPIFFLLTIPAWYSLLRRALDRTWARLGTLLLLLSPMAFVASGTLMAHTSELCLLTWSFWAGFRARAAAAWWPAALLGLLFAGAFFNRPLTALGLGTTVLVHWGASAVRGRRWVHLLAFLVPTTALAILFLLVNQWQNGSPTTVAYVRVAQYSVDNEYRFSNQPEDAQVAMPNLRMRSPLHQLRVLASGFTRIIYAAHGWPCAMLLLLFLPLGRPAVRLYGATILTFFAFHAFIADPGIDTFGPPHFFELILPLTVLLMAVGLEWEKTGKPFLGLKPWPVFLAMIFLSLTFYTPIRLLTVHSITTSIRRAPDLTAHLENAIVYVPHDEWAPQCDSVKPEYHVFWRPNPRPDWSDSVLYANHISVEEDRAHHARRYPERKAYLLKMREQRGTCSLELLDLDSPEADPVPPGRQTYPKRRGRERDS